MGVKQMLFRYQGHIGTYLIMGGVDVTGPHLYEIAAHGSTSKVPYCTMGSGTLAAMSVLESRWVPDMSEEDAKQLVMGRHQGWKLQRHGIGQLRRPGGDQAQGRRAVPQNLRRGQCQGRAAREVHVPQGSDRGALGESQRYQGWGQEPRLHRGFGGGEADCNGGGLGDRGGCPRLCGFDPGL